MLHQWISWDHSRQPKRICAHMIQDLRTKYSLAVPLKQTTLSKIARKTQGVRREILQAVYDSIHIESMDNRSGIEFHK